MSSFLVFRGSPSFFSFFVPLGSAQLSGVVEVVNGGWGQTDGNQVSLSLLGLSYRKAFFFFLSLSLSCLSRTSKV